MSETARILDQLERSFRGEAWHGPSVMEALDGVGAAAAAARPLAEAHTIWELVLHVTAWMEVLRRALKGEVTDALSPEEDWPRHPAGGGEAPWRAALAELERTHREIAVLLERFPAERLDDHAPRKPYTFYLLLHGVIQHNLYHAGQIVLLRKAEAAGEASPRGREARPPAGRTGADECWIPDRDEEE